MAIRLTKAWRELEAGEVACLPGQLGVYQIASGASGGGESDGDGGVLCIGVAGGRSRFGLRGELEAELVRRGPGFRFRVEVNTQYHTRYRELLMLHQADHGALPPENEAPPGLGRLRPA